MMNNQGNVLLTQNWQRAAIELGIRVHAPFELGDSPATPSAVAYLPDFGGPNGTIIDAAWDDSMSSSPEIVRFAHLKGMHYSLLNAHEYLEYEAGHYQETLRDWGFYGASPPQWI